MNASVFDRLQKHLLDAGIEFRVLRHEAVYTSEEAAAVRGVELSSGAKALVLKAADGFLMCVLPADLRLDSQRVRDQLGTRRLRFASREEVLELTGLKPGSIPPFGSLFGLDTLCDERLANESEINFNAGDHSISIAMTPEDYIATEKPKLGVFGEDRE